MVMKTIGIPSCTGTPGQPPKILVEKSSLVFPKMAPFKLSQGKNTTPLKLAYMKDSTAFRKKS